MTDECVITTSVPYEKGFIHYVKRAENGTIEVYRRRGGRTKKTEKKD